MILDDFYNTGSRALSLLWICFDFLPLATRNSFLLDLSLNLSRLFEGYLVSLGLPFILLLFLSGDINSQ